MSIVQIDGVSIPSQKNIKNNGGVATHIGTASTLLNNRGLGDVVPLGYNPVSDEGTYGTTIFANVLIATDTTDNLNEYILPEGQLAYATNTQTLIIGDGAKYGGKPINNAKLYSGSTETLTRISTSIDTDPLLITSVASGNRYIGRTEVIFYSENGISPKINISEYQSIFHKLIQITYNEETGFMQKLSEVEHYWSDTILVTLNGGNNQDLYISNPSGVSSFFKYESEFLVTAASSDSISLKWGLSNNGSITRLENSYITMDSIV